MTDKLAFPKKEGYFRQGGLDFFSRKKRQEILQKITQSPTVSQRVIQRRADDTDEQFVQPPIEKSLSSARNFRCPNSEYPTTLFVFVPKS